jgi:hypothetical protein
MANVEIASVGRIIAATFQRKNPAHRKPAKSGEDHASTCATEGAKAIMVTLAGPLSPRQLALVSPLRHASICRRQVIRRRHQQRVRRRSHGQFGTDGDSADHGSRFASLRRRPHRYHRKTLPDLDANAVRDISIALLVTGAFYWVAVSVMNHR